MEVGEMASLRVQCMVRRLKALAIAITIGVGRLQAHGPS